MFVIVLSELWQAINVCQLGFKCLHSLVVAKNLIMAYVPNLADAKCKRLADAHLF